MSNTKDNKLRKVFCRTDTGNIAWAYKDDTDASYIPDKIYKVSMPYMMEYEEIIDQKFERWVSMMEV